jgi:two-component system, response regulator
LKTDYDILLIDDDEADVELALHALRENKLVNHIHVLRDGEEALEYLFGPGREERLGSGHMPKLILLDLKLPKVDGIEVLRRIKSDPETKFTPVVILTSSKEERDLVRGYDLGVNSYIRKPVDFDQFREMVRQVGLYWLVTNQPAPLPTQAAAL